MRGDCLADSEPSFDSARGVSGGVLFVLGEVTPSVSFACSRCVFKEESAVFVGVSDVGVLGIEPGCEDAWFEICAAWTGASVVTLDKVLGPPDSRRVRNGMTKFAHCCRSRLGRQEFAGSVSAFW